MRRSSNRIAFVSKNRELGESPQNAPGDVYVLTPATGAMTNLTNGRVKDAWSVAWSPVDDRLLIYSLYGQTWYEPPETAIRLLDLGTGELDPITVGPQTVSAPVWSPDGARYAYVEGATVVRVRSEGRGEAWINVADELSGELTWSPDGSAVLAAALDPRQSSVVIPLADGPGAQEPLQIEFDADRPFVGPPQWAPLHPAPAPQPPTIAGTGLDQD